MNHSHEKPVMFFLGDVALDEYYQAPYWPKVSEKILVHPKTLQPGGMIANAACVASSLGAETHFLALLNNGEITRLLIEDLQQQGINTKWVLYDPSLPDAKTIIILAEDEHTVFIPTLGIQRIEIPESALAFIKQADYLYTTLCEVRPVVCAGKSASELLKQIRMSGCKVVFDMDVDSFQGEDEVYLEGIDFLFINETGFSRLKGEREEDDCVRNIFQNGLELLIVTKGSKGCRVYTSDQAWDIPGIPVDVVDVTGAGDTFASSFMHAYHKWKDPRKAAVFATGAAARCVGAFGARSGVGREQDVFGFLKKFSVNVYD